jgi:hypothetical protein
VAEDRIGPGRAAGGQVRQAGGLADEGYLAQRHDHQEEQGQAKRQFGQGLPLLPAPGFHFTFEA